MGRASFAFATRPLVLCGAVGAKLRRGCKRCAMQGGAAASNAVGHVGRDAGGAAKGSAPNALDDTFYSPNAVFPMAGLVPRPLLEQITSNALKAMSSVRDVPMSQQIAVVRGVDSMRLAGCALRQLLPEPDLAGCAPREAPKVLASFADPGFCVGPEHGFVESEWVEAYDDMTQRARALWVEEALAGGGVVMGDAEMKTLADALRSYHAALHVAEGVRHDPYMGLPRAEDCSCGAGGGARRTPRSDLERDAGFVAQLHEDIDWRALLGALRNIFDLAAQPFLEAREAAARAAPASAARPASVSAAMARAASPAAIRAAARSAMPSLLAGSALRMAITHAMLLHIAAVRLGGGGEVRAAWMVETLNDVTERLLVSKVLHPGLPLDLAPDMEFLLDLRLDWAALAGDPQRVLADLAAERGPDPQSAKLFGLVRWIASKLGRLADATLLWYLVAPLATGGIASLVGPAMQVITGGFATTAAQYVSTHISGAVPAALWKVIGPVVTLNVVTPIMGGFRDMVLRKVDRLGVAGRILRYFVNSSVTEGAIRYLWSLVRWAAGFGAPPPRALTKNERAVRDLEAARAKQRSGDM